MRAGPAILRDSATISPSEDDGSPGSAQSRFVPALPYASCFAYSPSGAGAECDEARSMCAHLKVADGPWLARLAVRVWIEASGRGRFASVFGRHVVLIPVPGSAAGPQALWVGERLAWCLKEAGLAAAVWPVLTRWYPVRKSAFARAGERPSVLEHYASFTIDRAACAQAALARKSLPLAAAGTRPRLTLVDDVITRGRTLLAAAGRLRAAFPQAEIHAFALLRTLERGEPLERLLDPCEGEVRWTSGDARRIP